MASNEIPSAKPQTFAKAGVKCAAEEILEILRFVFLIPRRRNFVTRDMNLFFANKQTIAENNLHKKNSAQKYYFKDII